MSDFLSITELANAAIAGEGEPPSERTGLVDSCTAVAFLVEALANLPTSPPSCIWTSKVFPSRDTAQCPFSRCMSLQTTELS